MASKQTGEVNHLAATAEIVSSYLLNHKMDVDALDALIQNVYDSLMRATGTSVTTQVSAAGNITIEESITPDYIICLEDGKKLKMLKRYLKTNYDMTPEEYRKRWGLPANYPMVAPNYAKKRSQLAKSIGLGKKENTAAKTRRMHPVATNGDARTHAPN